MKKSLLEIVHSYLDSVESHRQYLKYEMDFRSGEVHKTSWTAMTFISVGDPTVQLLQDGSNTFRCVLVRDLGKVKLVDDGCCLEVFVPRHVTASSDVPVYESFISYMSAMYLDEVMGLREEEYAVKTVDEEAEDVRVKVSDKMADWCRQKEAEFDIEIAMYCDDSSSYFSGRNWRGKMGCEEMESSAPFEFEPLRAAHEDGYLEFVLDVAFEKMRGINGQ